MGVKMCWGAAVVCIVYCGLYILNVRRMFSIFDLLCVVPCLCETSSPDNDGYGVLTPKGTVIFCFASLVIVNVCKYLISWDDYFEVNSETSIIKQHNNINTDDEKAEEGILDATKALLDIADLEYKHCAAINADNHETYGRKVGGETERLSGVTTLEDKYTTHGIAGARLIKSHKEIEDDTYFVLFKNPLRTVQNQKLPRSQIRKNTNK